MNKKEDRIAYSFLLLYYLVMLVLAFIANGTGDDGDSVYHFLFSKYAFIHPENFINQWAKPVYVLLTAPVAQLGFTAVKIFNATVTTLAIYFSYRIVQLLKIPNGWFVVIALCCSPMYIHLSLSGLTEPLYALVLTIIIFLAIRRDLFWSALLASFLPFIRSEGLIFLCIYLLFLFVNKRWKLIPVLAAGHIIYSIIGWFHYQDFLWVFSKMSYAVLWSAYGSGSAFNFISGMVDFIGIPLIIMFCVGTVSGTVRFFRDYFRKENNISSEELWLIYGGFFSLWIGHMLFWQFGLFNSYGLIRVLIAVTPCAGIICLRGFNMTLDSRITSFRWVSKRNMAVLIVAAVIINPFIQLQWQRDFDLSAIQRATLKAAGKYRNRLQGYTFYSAFPYSSCVFGYDIFDSKQHRDLQDINNQTKLPEKSAIIWDNFYAASGTRIALSNLLADDRFEMLDTFQYGYHQRYGECAVLLYKGDYQAKWIRTDTLFENDFESHSFGGRDSLIVYSGRYSLAIDEKNQYSPGFSLQAYELGSVLPATFRVSAMFYIPVIPVDLFSHAVLVASLQHKDSVYFWQGLDITDVVKNGHSWERVSFNIKVPAARDATDVISFYVWNPHSTVLYMDDMVVEELKQKQD